MELAMVSSSCDINLPVRDSLIYVSRAVAVRPARNSAVIWELFTRRDRFCVCGIVALLSPFIPSAPLPTFAFRRMGTDKSN